jgi:glutaredoxin
MEKTSRKTFGEVNYFSYLWDMIGLGSKMMKNKTVKENKKMKGKTVEEKKDRGYIVIHTLPYCIYCKILKDTLIKMGIPFQDINIDENEKLGDKLEEHYQTTSWPIILFYPKDSNELPIAIISETNLEILDRVHIFNTIEQAIKILLTHYYEI